MCHQYMLIDPLVSPVVLQVSAEMYPKLLFFLFLLFFLGAVHCELCNKTALASVDVWVHRDRFSRAFSRRNVNFNTLDSFREVDVTRANVTRLCEGMIRRMPRLETLSLIGANLQSIDVDAFLDVPKLNKIYLSVNKLEKIRKGSFNNLDSLKILYLSNNRIDFIEEGTFENFNQLEAVYLDRNYLSSFVSNVFSGCPNIRVIDLSFNQIHQITDNAFVDLKPTHGRLLNINLNNNRLDQFSASSLLYVTAVDLRLKNNKLRDINSIFFNAKPHSKLNFSNNKISCIGDAVAEEMRNSTKSVIISNNPLECSCFDRIDDILGDEILGKGELIFDTNCVERVHFD